MGGFKINGPPRIGKGPMTSKEVSDTSNKASPPKPTQAGEDRAMYRVDKQGNEVPRKQRQAMHNEVNWGDDKAGLQ